MRIGGAAPRAESVERVERVTRAVRWTPRRVRVMLWTMVTLSAKFDPPDLEREYRSWEWSGALRRARIAIITASAVFLLFLYPDFLFFGLEWPFGGLLALRLSVVVLGAGALMVLSGPPRPRRFDVLVFLWTAWVGLLTAVILPATRPNAWILHGFIVCVGIPAIYLLVPLRFVGATLIGMGMAVGYLGFVAVTNSAFTYLQAIVLGFALFAANIFGMVTNRWLHSSQRASFLQERSLRRAEENLNTLVDAVPFPVALLALSDGRVRRLNNAARALFSGHTSGGPEVIIEGLAAGVSLSPSSIVAESEAVRELETFDGEGRPRWLLVSSRPMVHDNAPCMILSFVDITERKAAEETLAGAKKAADEASHAKSTFLATMSHEIRTPLHGVLGAVQLLERGSLDVAEREHVGTIRLCARGVLELVDGILDLSRAETGVIIPARLAFDPRGLISSLVESLSPRDASFDVRLDDALSPTLIGDEARVRRVLLNLLDNALKYGDGTPVGLELRVVGDGLPDGGSQAVSFAVDSGGPPIPPDLQSTIFEPFVQLDLPGVNRRGFGLGLAICRREVEAMGGTLVLESPTADNRTRFVFTLSLEPGPAELPEVFAVRPRAIRPLALLVAEDDAVSGRLALALLTDSGHRVTLVTSGNDALKLAAEQRFDAVLMDMRMPGLDGVEASRRIRALPDLEHATVPIIATTANAMIEERVRYLAAGISAVMPKPIDFDALEALLAETVGVETHEVAAPDPAQAPQVFEEAMRLLPLIDEALLARYVRTLGAQKTHALLALCVETGQPLVRSILQAPWDDLETASRHAHQLASAAYSATFIRMGHAAAHLERVARGDGEAQAQAQAREQLSEVWQATLSAYAERAIRQASVVVTSTPTL
jgi:signal transduction histidine kinase/DNA-binding response OmpR family regulator